ncbi:MAG TPA: hypothetical protein EYP68_02160, partial [Candidatus Korarchaeota archaeon]|nr:hypothetical protein [Candidatus Korarchaeota archaeon]
MTQDKLLSGSRLLDINMFDAVLLDVDGVLIKNPYRTIVFPEVARRIVKDAKVQDFVSFMMRESIRRIREGKLV